MKSFIIFVLFVLPIAVFAQPSCSVNLGDDVLQCNGNPITLTPITTGTDGEDSLRITYNASQGVTGLVGASEVYFHSAIQTIPFSPDWEYTVGNWGDDDGLGEMTAVGNNVWEITIHVDDYYGYPGGTNVIGLWMVFRNGDGSATGKDDNDQDIFLETSNNNTSTFGGVTGTDVPGGTGSFMWGGGESTETLTVTQTGTYSVTFTDGVGCSSSDDVYVEFGTGNIQVDLGPDTSLCDGDIITLDAGSGFATYEWSTSETSQTLEVSLPGDYAVTVTDNSGCTGIDLIHIVTGTSPDADFSYAAVTGTTVSFTDIGSDATTVYWDFDGDGNVDETTGPGATVEYDFGSASVFGVIMISENGCGADTSSQNVLVQDVGIEEVKAQIGFSVYPNPTIEDVSIAITDASVEVSSVSLFDLQGQMIMSESSVQNNLKLSLNKLPKGMYVLQVQTTAGLINQRIQKK
jgi:hypothetical protein